MDYYIKLISLCILLLLSGFFSSSETAFFSLSKVRLRRKKFRRARGFKYILRLLKSPSTFLTTVLIGNEVVNISISVVAAALLYSLTKDMLSDTALPFCSMALTVPVLLLFGEIIPKTLAVKFPETIARANAYPLYFFSSIIVPVRYLLNNASKIFISFFVRDPSKYPVDSVNIDEDIFKSMVDVGRKEGTIEPEERELIIKTFRLDDINISQIMTPREKIIGVPVDISEEAFIRTIEEEKFSRYPVYDKTIDHIAGFVHAKDLLRLKKASLRHKQMVVGSLLRKPIFVREDRNAHSVFLEFQKLKRHIGIVTDLSGNTAGIVTLEDILEELFGEILDETDMEDQNQ